eukprot:gb/GEZN01009851.1/.p1 GENE.gb/GEZN01009851.1/~~gb/GEZN01009851.1/.p1  ORF type:complete len:404 (-),score=44.99 gb/GEZN01009851.1/:77-1258(-)
MADSSPSSRPLHGLAPSLLLENPYSKGRVLLIATGGTICMEQADECGPLSPANTHGFLKRLVTSVPSIGEPGMPLVNFIEWVPIDSSDMTPDNWGVLAKQVASQYFNYDGFVILMGTDTMAYCASALSFMFQNLGKTVILTGSMLPIRTAHTDAKRNLLVSLKLAMASHIPEVCIFFNSRLLRGNRARKVFSHKFDAFQSPNMQALATVGVDVRYKKGLILPPPRRKFSVAISMCCSITVIHLTPGFDDHVFDAIKLASKNTRRAGLVLQLYGSGNNPTRPAFLNTLEEMIKSGMDIVVLSQCPAGSVDLGMYDGGAALAKLGVINGRDMTPEACVTKFAFCLGHGVKGEKLRLMMESSLRGELTPPASSSFAMDDDDVPLGTEWSPNLQHKL